MATGFKFSSSKTAWAKLDAELAGFPKQLSQTHIAAVTKTADQSATMILKRFKDEYPNIVTSKIKSGEYTKRKRPLVRRVHNRENQPTGVVSVRDLKIPMIAFKPTGGGTRIPSKAGGVNVLMDKSKGRELFRHAFKVRMRSGHVAIVSRVAAKTGGQWKPGWKHKTTLSGYAARLPIRELFGPSIYDLVDIPKINLEVQSKIDAILIKNIEGQISRVPLLKK